MNGDDYDEREEELDQELMEDIAERGWPSRSQWENFRRALNKPVDDVSWARELKRRRDFEQRMKQADEPAAKVAALQKELAAVRKELAAIKKKLRAKVEDMTDIEVQDELAEAVGGNTFEQEVDRLMRYHADRYGSRQNCVRAYKRRLAEHRPFLETALRHQRAEEAAREPLDLADFGPWPPPPPKGSPAKGS
jgi:hypothetical protein